MKLRQFSIPLVGIVLAACGRLPGGPPAPATVWLLPLTYQGNVSTAQTLPIEVSSFAGALIVIDSATLRPTVMSAAPGASVETPRAAVVTTFQGNRYHPESIRALNEDPAAVATFAGRVVKAVAAAGTAMFVDFQGETPDELRGSISMARSLADSARAKGIAPIAVIVPPGDTVAYPTSILARTFDLIVVRLNGEHRNGTSPGALISPEWMTRQIGMRAAEIGLNRLVAELPLFGYRWDANGNATRITFAEAETLIRSEAGVFRRDPATGSLTATSSRNGWTVWIEDAETLERLIDVARRQGIKRFALLGPEGADPNIWTRIPAALKR